jgi:hypothetical protein
MTATLADIGPYMALILVGFLPNEIWRLLGIFAAHGLDEDSEILVWVRAVATAVLAAVVAQLIVNAPGALALVPLGIRVGAMAAGFVGFLLMRRSLFAGVVTGEIALLAGAYWSGL